MALSLSPGRSPSSAPHHSPLEGESQKPSRSPELVEGQATADAVGGVSPPACASHACLRAARKQADRQARRWGVLVVTTAIATTQTHNPFQPFPCLRRGLFLARPRKRPKKKGACLRGAPRCRQAAQAPRGLLFRELPLWSIPEFVPCERWGIHKAKALDGTARKSPFTPHRTRRQARRPVGVLRQLLKVQKNDRPFKGGRAHAQSFSGGGGHRLSLSSLVPNLP